MKRILLTLIAVLLMIFGCFSFAQESEWIKYDSGTITVYSPDRSYGIVIQDKNLGATMTGGGKNAPTESYGNYYQWGNNYGFPSDPNAEITISSDQVDTSGYGPENQYYSNIFIKRPTSYSDTDNISDRSKELNDNLRGGEGDDDTNGWGLQSNNPITGRQGPCPEGYHVPSIGELDELAVVWYNNKYRADMPLGYTIEELGLAREDVNITTVFSEELLIPFSSLRWGDDGSVDDDGYGFVGNLWSSTPYFPRALNLTVYNLASGILKYILYVDASNYRATGLPIRCFKNEHIYPAISNTLTLNVLSGENLVSTGVSFTNNDPLTSGQVLEAIDWLSDEIELSTGYHFEWYADDGGVETGFDLDTAISEGTITSNIALTGKIEPNKYTISFLDENGAEIMSGEFTYDQETTLPTNTSTKEGYTFKGWKDSQGNIYEDGATIKNLTTENGAVLEFNPIREQNSKPKPVSHGGGGSTLRKDNCPDGDFSDSYYDGICGENPKDSSSLLKPGAAQAPQNNSEEVSLIKGDGEGNEPEGFSQEIMDAYTRAYKNGITTMDTIEKADLNGYITRIAMAKMLSKYAINVLGMKPANTIVPKFSDITEKLNAEYNYGVTQAYQLGIMGINMGNKFRPFDNVTRAEFVTALSRMKHNTPDGTDVYYSTHMELIEKLGIITNTNPSMLELRGYVMLMLMRSAK